MKIDELTIVFFALAIGLTALGVCTSEKYAGKEVLRETVDAGFFKHVHRDHAVTWQHPNLSGLD